jgi:membrane dipeptidase
MKLIDLHEDLAHSSSKMDVRKGKFQSSIELLKTLGEPLVFSVLYPHANTWDERATRLSERYGFATASSVPMFELLVQQIKFYYFLERSGLVRIVRGARDLDSPGVKLLLAMEGVDVLTDPYDAYILRDLNVRSIGLTWNYDTKFAASCMSSKDYGLTGYGEELVRLCNNLGILVDLAHASKQSLLDAAQASKAPLIVSHANSRRVRDHVRNLDDEELEALAKTGGVVGITGINSTLGDNGTIQEMVEHANYIGNSYGWKHVALGTDFLGVEHPPKGFEDISKVHELGALLGEHGDEVLWKNAERVVRLVVT